MARRGHWLDLRGPAACELLSAPEVEALLARLGPDPLRGDADPALAYARILCNRAVHEEALEALKLTRPEQVVDPAAYLFHRALSEHALLDKSAAISSMSSGSPPQGLLLWALEEQKTETGKGAISVWLNTAFNRFKDQSGRSSYFSREFFARIW